MAAFGSGLIGAKLLNISIYGHENKKILSRVKMQDLNLKGRQNLLIFEDFRQLQRNNNKEKANYLF